MSGSGAARRDPQLRIVADERVPLDEAWLTQPVGYDVQIHGARLVLTRYDHIVGKIVGPGRPSKKGTPE